MDFKQMTNSSFFIYIEKWFLKRLKQVSSRTTIHRETPREINKKERVVEVKKK